MAATELSMITSTTWVPRGYAAEFPTKYEFTDEEYARVKKLTKSKLDYAQTDLDHARDEQGEGNGTSSSSEGENESLDEEEDGDGGVELDRKAIGTSAGRTTAEIDDDLREYDLENYDDSADDEDETMEDDTEGRVGGSGIFANIKSLVYHHGGEDDPYISLPDEDEDSEERVQMQILPSDSLVLAARVEDEIAHLEVYVYEDEEDNLYVHHDIMLPAIPLCVEWLDIAVGKGEVGLRGNSVAVATMDPDIEIWDLDVIDCMYPNAVLGRGGVKWIDQKKKIGGKKKSKKPNDEYHVDAVISLASNRQHRNLLASASADETVKLWDVNTTKCAKSYSYHTNKVTSIAWHPKESTALLSGGYDDTAVVADMRATEPVNGKWAVNGTVESVKWDPHNTNHFYVSTDNGVLFCFDARVPPPALSSNSTNPSPGIWRLQAHDETLSSFDINPHIPGYIATGSEDKQTKLWNVGADSSGPSMVVSRDMGVGRVFSARFAPDPELGFRLAIAGLQGDLQIWDTSTNAAIRRTFAERVAPSSGEEKEDRVITIAKSRDDYGDDDDDDDEMQEEDN